ncbi:MAG: phenylalanine--tRNA ligase subunit beta [Candidatus Cloacimonetes bacterium]|nr:phenylalanine--tRNA ligase subunit beta [Candidatus Cloacimonadota bacterium]MCF7814595.1 phenylalanine--tRNA ligase subunit beta [Candidatus Cloacimonadota bacterium]MCF7869075.1 phenylalanine--tRNA ligase subunit beta [Candidatus Cloacimonadota bacterium]MCF7884492.1 phenylalanine--tRNA ligase subunit beta [Candidatus Cloacimonadota bacterium]
MKISYNWLKDYLDFDLSPRELEEKMTFAGIEVEAVEELGKELNQIKIAEIVEKQTHPNSDHLSICKVNDGNETLQVICGAPNCAAGQKVALAPVGAQIGDFEIKKAKLRGEVSFGMLCSEKELGISDNHDGIMELPEDAPIGNTLASYLKMDDVCYDVEITPNRPDLLGMFGVARDLSALLNLPLKHPEIQIKETEEKIEDNLSLQNDAPRLCTRYTARMIKGVTIKESPEWLKQRLISVGLRPINNVVDVTNFVMMEFGHPLHAFDYSLLDNKKIIVRTAMSGEKFPALDEETYKLDSSDLVIADNKKPVALAGIIGGENSHITETTKDIVIEAANFLYSNIRKTAGRLKISTDSCYRFERDIADETAETVSRRAAQLILETAGGKLLKGKLDSYPNPLKKKIVSIRPGRIELLLTVKLSNQQIKDYLTPLGLEFIKDENDALYFSIPPYRKDLRREVDLIEEVMRLHGYNNVETKIHIQNVMNRNEFYAKRKIIDILVQNGYSEVKNWNFSDPEDLEKLKIADDDQRRNNAILKNPLGSRFSIMQSMLLPNLLTNSLYNINHGQKNLKLFEMAKVFFRKDEKLATEKWNICAVTSGNFNLNYWKEKDLQVDFFDLKGSVEEILEYLGLNKIKFQKSEENYYQPVMSADVYLRNKKVGSFGKLDPKILTEFDIEIPMYSMYLDVSEILNSCNFADPVYSDIPKFPPVLRDLSFVISREYNYEDIAKTIKAVNPGIISKVELFDEFTGKNIKEGFRSLTFSVVFSSGTKTLTDETVNKILQKIIKKLETDFSIEMR